MLQILDSTCDIRPRNNPFLCCFGFPRKIPRKKPPDAVMKPGARWKDRWFSWSLFRIRKSQSDVKTVPVDAAVSEKAKKSQPILAAKKTASKSHHAVVVQVIPAALPNQTVRSNPQKANNEINGDNIILEAREDLDDTGSSKKDTCQKQLSVSVGGENSRKTSCNHPSSPKKKRPKPGRTNSTLSQSESLPPPKRKKLAGDAAGNSQDKGEKLQPVNGTVRAGKLDPVIGLSIILVTLVIMIVWGRLCAVLCTCAWFYSISRLRTRGTGHGASGENGSDPIELDLNLEERKRKIVLEGFLERTRRSALGNL